MISIISTLHQEDTQHFVDIVATQALCLLKMGDFLTSQMFAEQEWELSTDYLDSRLSRSSKTWCNNYLLSRRFMSQCRCCWDVPPARLSLWRPRPSTTSATSSTLWSLTTEVGQSAEFSVFFVYLLKGIKMNPEQESFHHGVEKCKETISNIVRSREFNTIII